MWRLILGRLFDYPFLSSETRQEGQVQLECEDTKQLKNGRIVRDFRRC